MFPVPDNYTQFKIIALDPGLNNIGVAIFDIEAYPLKIVRIHALTLKEERVLDTVTLDDDYTPDRTMKRGRMVAGVMKFIRAHDPISVVSESPFFNRLMPSSFAVLTEVINDIFKEILEYNNNIRLSTVEPLLVKHTLGVAGKKGKDVVREAMNTRKDILDLLDVELDFLDEHAIDAIGVGVTYFTRRLSLGEPKK